MGLWVKPHATGQKYFIMAIINALHVCQIIKIDTFLFPIWDRPNKCKKLLRIPCKIPQIVLPLCHAF